MKTIKSILLISLCMALLTAFKADQKKETLLRLDMSNGKKVKMKATMKMDYFKDKALSNKVMSTDFYFTTGYTVTDRLDGGIHAIEYVISRVKMDQSMGMQSVSYDSDEAEGSAGMAAMIEQQLRPIINAPINFKVNARGEIVEQPEQVGGSASTNPQNLAERAFLQFPEEPVYEGYNWTEADTIQAGQATITATSQYTVTEITNEKVNLKLSIEPNSIVVNGEEQENMEMEQAGQMVFDKATGQMLSMEMNQSLTLQDPVQGEMFMVSTVNLETE